MTRLISSDPPPKRARRISEVSLALALVAMGFMIGEWVVDPTGGSAALALAQVVLAVVCLVFGAIYLFTDRTSSDDGTGGSEVIDLRDEATVTEPSVGPRQVPDARDGHVFAT